MKPLKYILTFIFLLLLSYTEAQFRIPKKAYWHLSGTIGETIHADLNLVKVNDSLYADCSYLLADNRIVLGSLESQKPYILSGKMDAKGNFQLKPFGHEFPDLTGQLFNSGSFRGDCKEGKDKKAYRFDLNEINPSGSVQFNVYFLQQMVNLVKKPKSPAGVIQMSLLSPLEAGNPVISDTLRNIVLKTFNSSGYRGNNPDSILNGNFKVFKDAYLSGNEDLYRQKADAGSLNWELLKYRHVVCNMDYILSFYILNYAFTGGAHGLENLDYTNVDLKKGRLIKLDDILPETGKQQLSMLLTRKLKQMNKLTEAQKLSENGYFVDEIQPNENFYLTPYGIGFVYNHYDIAPYSFGATDIFLTADEVRDLIRPFMKGK